MQYALHYKKAKTNSELPPNLYAIPTIFKWKCWVRKRFVVIAVTKYLKRVLKTRTLISRVFFWLHLLEKLQQLSMVLHCILHLIFLSGQGWNPMLTRTKVAKSLHILRNKYQHLQVLLIDEILMTVVICGRFFLTSTC